MTLKILQHGSNTRYKSLTNQITSICHVLCWTGLVLLKKWACTHVLESYQPQSFNSCIRPSTHLQVNNFHEGQSRQSGLLLEGRERERECVSVGKGEGGRMVG